MEECSDRRKHEILPALRSLEIMVQKDKICSTVSSFAFINSDLVNMVVSRWNEVEGHRRAWHVQVLCDQGGGGGGGVGGGVSSR